MARCSARRGHPHDAQGGLARYPVLLIKGLVIHALVVEVFPLMALVIEVALILLAGWVFHLVFERSAFIIRERLVPSRVG